MNKRDIIRQYVIENEAWTVPSRALAKIIVAKYPEKFGEYNNENIEKTRSVVRCIRYSNGLNSTGYSKKDLMFSDRFHEFVKPDHNEYTPFVITDCDSLLVMNDLHIPFHDKDALNAAIEWGVQHGVDGVLLNGDIIDCYKQSIFLKDANNRSIVQEFEMLREFIDDLSFRLKCPIYYKLGNHEERIELDVMRHVPELVKFFTFENALRNNGEFILDDYNLTIIRDRRVVKFAGLSILHGHEYGRSMNNPVGVARWLYMKAKDNAMAGHLHKADSFGAKKIGGDTIMCWAVGHLSDPSPKYRPLNDWQQGFARVRRDGDVFKVTNLLIENGRVL